MLNLVIGLVAGIVLTFVFLRYTLGATHYPPVKKPRDEWFK
jgi:uncharacterized membrane-anchored protein YhcB (DUF1043 family)